MNEQNIQTNPKPNLDAFQGLLELDQKERTFKARQSYFRAYIFSFLIPPVGVYYFIKYAFFSDGTADDLKAGIISLALTMFSLLLSIWLIGDLFKQSTSAIPSQNIDVLKELITPENQKKFKDLYQ